MQLQSNIMLTLTTKIKLKYNFLDFELLKFLFYEKKATDSIQDVPKRLKRSLILNLLKIRGEYDL